MNTRKKQELIEVNELSKIMSLWAFLVIVFGVQLANSNPVEISVISGLYWSEQPEKIIYQSSVPLVFKTFMPNPAQKLEPSTRIYDRMCNPTNNSTIQSAECQNRKLLSHLQAQLAKHLREFQNSLGLNLNQQTPPPSAGGRSRETRAIEFIGEALNWCCGVLTQRTVEPLFSNEENIKKVVDNLNIAVDENHKELQDVISSIKKYSVQISGSLRNSQEYDNKIKLMLDKVYNTVNWQLSEAEQNYAYINQNIIRQATENLEMLRIIEIYKIISQCRDNKIPTEIITPVVLRKHLYELDATLRKKGHELVIRPQDVTKYLRLDIATCLTTDDEIIVTLKVPVRKVNHSWKLYKLLRIPFAWEEHTCVFSEEEIRVAKHDSTTVILSGDALTTCDDQSNFCLLPRPVETNYRKNSQCLSKLAAGAKIAELTEVCKLICSPSQGMLINQIEPEKFVITHPPKSLSLKCGEQTEKFDIIHYKEPGSIELNVPCQCALISDPGQDTLINSNFPCDFNSNPEFKMVHIIPAIWSKFDSFKVAAMQTHTHLTLGNFSECIKSNLTLPEFTLSNSTPKTIRLETIELKKSTLPDYDPWHVWKIMNILVTFFVALILIRNPYLIGLAAVPRVEANEGVTSYDIVNMCGQITVIIIIIVVAIWAFIKFILRTLKVANKSQEGEVLEMVNSSNDNGDRQPSTSGAGVVRTIPPPRAQRRQN